MVWSHDQRMRLAIEKEKLEKYFLLGVTWIDPRHETKVEVLLKSNSNKEYKLRIYIPFDFPNSCPALVVVSPPELFLKDGLKLPEISDSFHTLEDTDGFHRICHFYPPEWTPDITLYQVFMKGRLWIEAYEAHLDTGKDMDVFLGEQKFSAASEEPYYESDSSIGENVLGADQFDSDFVSDTCLELSRHEPLADPPFALPVNYTTSPPLPHPSNQTLPTNVGVWQPMFQPPSLFPPHLPDDDIDFPPTENKDSQSSELYQLPLSHVEHLSPQHHAISYPNNNINNSNNNNSNKSSSIISHSPNDSNNELQEQSSSPNNHVLSRRYRPTGGVDVLRPFHEEMVRRNSSSRGRASVVPPPVKPKPQRPR